MEMGIKGFVVNLDILFKGAAVCTEFCKEITPVAVAAATDKPRAIATTMAEIPISLYILTIQWEVVIKSHIPLPSLCSINWKPCKWRVA